MAMWFVRWLAWNSDRGRDAITVFLALAVIALVLLLGGALVYRAITAVV